MKLGIICGRFQVASLTEGHKLLIKTVLQECDSVLVCVGVSSVRNTRNEPLPYICREQMLQEYYQNTNTIELFQHKDIFPQFVVKLINDIGNNVAWCEELDKLVDEHKSDMVNVFDEVIIYGSRDSVAQTYVGKYNTKILDEVPNVSGTKSRSEIKPSCNVLFREGMIYSSQWKYPQGFPTADVACFRFNKISNNKDILLCRKPNRTQFQLPGGFFDPLLDKSLENTALRELFEECNISADITDYVGSYVVDDFRYRKEIDKIVTMVYECHWIEGEPIAKDDVVEVMWFDLSYVMDNYEDLIFPAHQLIIQDVISNHLF